MNWKKRKGNGNNKRLPPTSCMILFFTPGLLQLTFWRKMKTHEVMEQWYCILTGNDTYNIDANTLVQKILTRHGKDMREKEVNGHVTKPIEMIGQAMTTNRKSKLPKGWKTLLSITTPLERHEGKGHESNWKDMSGQVSKWIERKGKGKGNEQKTTTQKLEPVVS